MPKVSAVTDSAWGVGGGDTIGGGGGGRVSANREPGSYMYLSICQTVLSFLDVNLALSLSLSISLILSLYLSTYLSTYLPICLSMHSTTYIHIYIYRCIKLHMNQAILVIRPLCLRYRTRRLLMGAMQARNLWSLEGSLKVVPPKGLGSRLRS